MDNKELLIIYEIITDLLKNSENLAKLASEQRKKGYMTRNSEIASMYESNADDFAKKANDLAEVAIYLKSTYIG